MADKAKARDINRRIELPEAGEGIYLVLRNSGVRVLHAKYGNDHIKDVNDAFITADIAILEELLSLMAHRGDEKVSVAFDDLDNMSLQTLTDRLRDAWSLSIHGMTFEEQVAHLRLLLAEAEGEEPEKSPLLTSPEATSDTSSEPLSGQA